MSKRKLSIVAIALLTIASQSVVTAQVSRARPIQHQLMSPSMPEPQIQQQVKVAPVKRQMSQPGTEDMPVSQAPIRINPIQMYNLARKPFMAETEEGQVVYFYEGERLIEEHIGHGEEMIVGQYRYDRYDRFEHLVYSDGISITAKYGSRGELLTLTSGSGRAVGFHYPVNEEGQISVITPSRNFLQFHSAVAILRLKRQPYWWPATIPPLEHLREAEGKEGKATPSGNGWEEGNEYPYDPFPGTPKTPDGTSEIQVVAPRLPPAKLPPPFVNPVYRDGLEIIPTGGPGAGRPPTPKGGGIIAGELEGLEGFDTKIKMKERCHNFCAVISKQINARCKTGPTLSDKDDCWDKRDNFNYRCATACDMGDYQLDFIDSMSPEQKDFAPWDPNWKVRL